MASTPASADKTTLKRKASFFESMGTDMIELYVGKDEKMMRVHKDLLCEKIPYFQKLFGGSFRKSSESKAMFPEDDVKAFELLVQWVYRDKISEPSKVEGDAQMYSAYFLAEKLRTPVLMDQIMTIIQEFERKHNQVPTQSTTRKVYLRTQSGSPLRRYCTKAWHWLITSFSSSGENPDRVHEISKIMDIKDFVIDFMRESRQTSGKKTLDPRKLPHCDYHHHGKEQQCPLTMEDN